MRGAIGILAFTTCLAVGGIDASAGEGNVAELQLNGTAPSRVHSSKALRAKLADLRKRQAAANDASSTLAKMGKEAMPPGLPPRDRATWPKFTTFLKSSASSVDAMASAWSSRLDEFEKRLNAAEASGDSNALKDAAKRLSALQALFDQESLQVRGVVGGQSNQFTMISNIMKNKHDTARAAINNIR